MTKNATEEVSLQQLRALAAVAESGSFTLAAESLQLTQPAISHLVKRYTDSVIFDNRIRLGIMSTLVVNTEMSYNDLKELLQVTDGNLASHLKGLEDNNYIKVKKGFIGRKTNTTYSITKAGEKAFKQHLDALEQMIKGTK